MIQADSERSVRPISLDANTPAEIDAMVDPTITYGKVKILLNFDLNNIPY